MITLMCDAAVFIVTVLFLLLELGWVMDSLKSGYCFGNCGFDVAFQYCFDPPKVSYTCVYSYENLQ